MRGRVKEDSAQERHAFGDEAVEARLAAGFAPHSEVGPLFQKAFGLDYQQPAACSSLSDQIGNYYNWILS